MLCFDNATAPAGTGYAKQYADATAPAGDGFSQNSVLMEQLLLDMGQAKQHAYATAPAAHEICAFATAPECHGTGKTVSLRKRSCWSPDRQHSVLMQQVR